MGVLAETLNGALGLQPRSPYEVCPFLGGKWDQWIVGLVFRQWQPDEDTCRALPRGLFVWNLAPLTTFTSLSDMKQAKELSLCFALYCWISVTPVSIIGFHNFLPKESNWNQSALHLVGTLCRKPCCLLPATAQLSPALESPTYQTTGVPTSRNKTGGWWLVVSRHCLGAASDREQRAHDVLYAVCLFRCWNCHPTTRKRHYSSGLIGKASWDAPKHAECRDRPPECAPRMRCACQKNSPLRQFPASCQIRDEGPGPKWRGGVVEWVGWRSWHQMA